MKMLLPYHPSAHWRTNACCICGVSAMWPSSPALSVDWAALKLTVASAVYSAANLSGGHITPSVTIATMVTGHIGILKGLLYMLSQVGCTVWPQHLERVFAMPARRETLHC